MGLSKSMKDQILNGLIGRRDLNIYGRLFMGLSTTIPANDTGSDIAEVPATKTVTKPGEGDVEVETGYQRVLLGTSDQSLTQKMEAPVNGVSSNNAQILFPRALTSWGTIRCAVFYNTQTGGTPIGWSALTEAKEVPEGYVANFDKGAITFSLLDTSAVVEPEGEPEGE